MGKEKRFEKLKGAIIGVILTLVLIAAVPASARVAQETITVNFNNIRIVVDGRQVQTQYEPFIFQSRTYLPVRDVANAMGFDVAWEGSTNTVYLTSQAGTNVVPAVPQPTTTNPAISLERAIEIAYADLAARGINATFRANSGISWERGQRVWELEFRPTASRGVIEYYINVNTGAVVKFEWDN